MIPCLRIAKTWAWWLISVIPNAWEVGAEGLEASMGYSDEFQED